MGIHDVRAAPPVTHSSQGREMSQLAAKIEQHPDHQALDRFLEMAQAHILSKDHEFA